MHEVYKAIIVVVIFIVTTVGAYKVGYYERQPITKAEAFHKLSQGIVITNSDGTIYVHADQIRAEDIPYLEVLYKYYYVEIIPCGG